MNIGDEALRRGLQPAALPEAVEAFLRRNPGWLAAHADLYALLDPPQRVHGERLADHMAALLLAARSRADRLAGKSRMDFVRLVAHGLSAISVFGDIIGVRLLVATMGLIALTVVGLATTVFLRVATDLPIPGWATSTFGLLTVILFQAVMLSIQFSFIVLGGRQGTSFLPCRDYAFYVAEVIELDRGPASGLNPAT